jgi:hypothetical protein
LGGGTDIASGSIFMTGGGGCRAASWATNTKNSRHKSTTTTAVVTTSQKPYLRSDDASTSECSKRTSECLGSPS